jgi:transposase
VRSEQATNRELHTLNSRMLKQAEGSRKTFKKLCQQAFACRIDALAAIEQWQEKQTPLTIKVTVLEVPVYESKGRPGKNQHPVRTYYEISSNLYTPLEKRDEATKQLGLFILATNDIGGSLSMAEMLSTYKSQQAVEKEFRFLKSPDFLTLAFYVKKPERRSAAYGHDDVFNGLCGIGAYDP